MQTFSSRIIAWQRQHGRHTLPWQASRDPYRIWLSEIMLQQTQVASVIPYFQRFIAHFPDLQTLASAPQDAVLAQWSGLGYYTRARNLHRVAQHLCENHAGQFPQEVEALQSLPGIGRSTAAAIAALAFGQTRAILDGNVKRVLARHAGIDGWPGDKAIEARLWALAEARLPSANIETYTQGMMDLGASVCTRIRPTCTACPVSGDCVALQQKRVTELPTRKEKSSLPEKQVRMLIVLHGDSLLLEKRPSRGIWGGLWSFPELDLTADPVVHCETRLGMHVRQEEALPTLKHSFTHFHLYISPLLLTMTHPYAAEPQSAQNWFTRQDILQTAVPTPVHKLLKQLNPPCMSIQGQY